MAVGAAALERFRAALAAISEAVPRSIAGRLARLTTAGKKAKTHTFFLLAGPFGLFALACAKLDARLEDAMMRVLRVCCRLWDKVQKRSQLGALRVEVAEAVCAAERYMSATEMDIKFHNLIHLVDGIENLGRL